ncbi:MAG: flagellar basal body-associated FliL family protein [Spirochaetia bacterium]
MSDAEGSKKTPEKSAAGGNVLVRILVMVAAAIGAIVFVVLVSIFTVIMMDSQMSADIISNSPTYDTAMNYDYTAPVNVRGRTSDVDPHTFQISVALGYEMGDTKTSAEIAKRQSQLQDLMRSFFSSKTAEALLPEYQDGLKVELKERINRIFSQGKVRDVLFPDFLVD